MQNSLSFPCSRCGILNNVAVNAELVFCTACGHRLELGAHSYRETPITDLELYCNNCGRALASTAEGLIFSCNQCAEFVCQICAKLDNNRHYCPKCMSARHEPEPKAAPALRSRKCRRAGRGKKASKPRTGTPPSKSRKKPKKKITRK